MPVRIIDIAKKANVSHPVVSAVLNGGSKSVGVSKVKRQEILDIARRLNYVPNISARLLRGKASMTLGVLIDSEDSEVRFQQLRTIDRAAERHGYRLLITETHQNPERQYLNYCALRQYGVDGIICHASSLDDSLRNDPKVIVFGAEPVQDCSTVYYDIGTGYRQAAACFAAEGRQRPALIISDGEIYDSVRARHKEFLKLYPDAADRVFRIRDEQGHSDIRGYMANLLRKEICPGNIDAVIVQNDSWALALQGEAMKIGLRIPENLSIVGQDNSGFGTCAPLALSTIDPNLEHFGEEVIRLMLIRIAAPEQPPLQIMVETSLITRETTSCNSTLKRNIGGKV